MFEKVPSQLLLFLYFVGVSGIVCLIEVIALEGQASTQILQVLPRHFSFSNFTDKSFSNVIASTGQRATHDPQLKHFSESTSMSLGTVTDTPFLRKAFTIFSCCLSGISASISPPLEFTWADKIAIGTLYFRTILAVIGCGTCSSVNLKSILTIVLLS